MGCGASSDQKELILSPRGKHRASDASNQSRTSNFTTSYATGKHNPAAKYVPGYKPGSSAADAEAEFEKWKTKNKSNESTDASTVLVKPEKIVEDFVFGDFKIDTSDVQQQRIERLNRVRPNNTPKKLGHHSQSGGNLLGRRRSLGTFVMNDFTVKTTVVDEVDDPVYCFLHEIKVPDGFRHLKRVTTRALRSHPNRVKVAALSPSEKEYVSCSTEDNDLTLYDVLSGSETTTFSGHCSPIIGAVFSRDGKYLATTSRDNTVIVWDTMHKDNAKRIVRTLEHPSLPICLDFSHDALKLITGGQDKQCRVWNIDASEIEVTFSGHEGVVVCIAAHPKKAVGISGGGDRTLRLWDLTSGEALQQFIGHDGIIISVCFTPDGDRVLSNDDRACKLWNSETGACILNVTLQNLTSALTHGEFPPPMPLPESFTKHLPLSSKQLGAAPNGILGPTAVNACKIGANRNVFTLSCLLPGVLSRSYFAVACTNKTVYIISCATGREEVSVVSKGSVFALGAGRENHLMFGDIYGNVTLVTVVAK